MVPLGIPPTASSTLKNLSIIDAIPASSRSSAFLDSESIIVFNRDTINPDPAGRNAAIPARLSHAISAPFSTTISAYIFADMNGSRSCSRLARSSCHARSNCVFTLTN